MYSNVSLLKIGYVITKSPYASGSVKPALELAVRMQKKGHTVNIFLISDGIWLAKKNQQGPVIQTFKKLMDKGANIMASSDHLTGAGLNDNEVYDKIRIEHKPYQVLVENVMEHWDRVIVI